MIMYELLILMLISLLILIFFTYHPRNTMRYIFKFTTSILFVLICILGHRPLISNFDYFSLILLGLIFSLIGDVTIIVNANTKSKTPIGLLMGGISFSLAHIFYFIAFTTLKFINIKDILLGTLISLILIIIFKYNKAFDFKGKFKLVSIYIVIISFMVSKSISLIPLVKVNHGGIATVLIGTIFFVISDIMLAYVHFHKNPEKYVHAISLIFYYIGQSLIALSVSYI